MKGRFFLLAPILAVSIVVVAWFLTRPSTQTPPQDNEPSSFLLVTTDKSDYIQGENVMITIKNVSENRIFFRGRWAFQKHDGVVWMFYAYAPGVVVTENLGPGEEYHVIYPLKDFPQGRYRAILDWRWLWEGGYPFWVDNVPYDYLLTYPEFVVHPENSLIVTTDKIVYSPGEVMVVTIINISYRTLGFGGLRYDLVWERWDGTTWQHYESIVQEQMQTALGSGGWDSVTRELRRYDGEEFAPGRYRVGTKGIFAEFEVRAP